MAVSPRPRIGLALGGGAARGTAHIGVLKAFEENGLRPDLLAGTSIGAFIGALYAFGKPLDAIKEMARKMRWLDVTNFTVSRYGLLSNGEMRKVLEREIGSVTFEESPIPLAFVAADISTGERVVIDRGDVAEGVMASSCLPGIFVPVERQGRLLVDGGIVENVPISPLRKMGADLVIAVDLNGSHSYDRPENLIDVILNMLDIAIDTTTRIQLREADVLISLDLARYSRTDTSDADELYAEGYRGGIGAMKEIRRHLEVRRPKGLEWLKWRLRAWKSARSGEGEPGNGGKSSEIDARKGQEGGRGDRQPRAGDPRQTAKGEDLPAGGGGA
ncbi:MAG: patatin [Deltaproteobacteria bacterium]|nr:MAG: patatin [Deltaproteobacteria bacterium]